MRDLDMIPPYRTLRPSFRRFDKCPTPHRLLYVEQGLRSVAHPRLSRCKPSRHSSLVWEARRTGAAVARGDLVSPRLVSPRFGARLGDEGGQRGWATRCDSLRCVVRSVGEVWGGLLVLGDLIFEAN